MSFSPLRRAAVPAAAVLVLVIVGAFLWARGDRLGLAAESRPAAPAPVATATAGGRCLPDQLALSAGRWGVGAGNAGVVFVLTNRSTVPCFLNGFPGMQLLDAAGRPVPTRVLRTASYTVQEVSPRRVDLGPGGHASFDAGWSDRTGFPGVSCPTSASVQVTPPDDSAQVTTAMVIEACPDGTIHVSPVVAGAGGVSAP